MNGVSRPDHNDAADEGLDDEALRWAGDEEQGRPAPRLRTTVTSTVTVTVEELSERPAGDAGRRAAAVGFALPYLVLTIGWIFAVQLADSPVPLFAAILWQFGEFLAMLAAPLWFAATLTLTRDARPRVRVGWLALGTLLLLPWPVVLRFLAALQVAGSLS